MAKVTPQTIGELLYWSYANLAMRHSQLEPGKRVSRKIGFMIRAKLWKGLRAGTMDVGSYFDDEKARLTSTPGCWYCGSDERLSLDHIIPRLSRGSDGGENLVYACRSCNSSKGAKDLLVWMQARDCFPPLFLLRRYLKMAISYCREHDLIDTPLAETEQLKLELPFNLDLVPQSYPPAEELCMFGKPAKCGDSASHQP